MIIYRNTTLESSKNKVSGYACVFEKESVNLGGFTEIIHRGAITQETIEKSDIFANLDHDPTYIIARSRNGKGSLKLSVDDIGLYFEFELPQTEKGNEIRSYLERDEITQCSFCFSLDVNDKESQKWSIRNNTQYREIYKIDKLYDIALVFQPAYEQTSVSLRKAMEEEKDYISEQINILNEQRNMTPEEKQEQENNLKEIETLKSEVKELKEELLESEMQELEQKLDEKPAENEEKQEEKSTEMEEKPEEKEDEKESETVEDTPKEDEKQDENPEKQDDSEDEKEKVQKKSLDKQINIKNKRNHINMKQQNFLLKELRSAVERGKGSFKFPGITEVRTVTVTDQGEEPNVVAGLHDNIVDVEIKGILEPLFAKSIMFQLGCDEYKGYPMGDISIPRLDGGGATWCSEIETATATGVTMSNVVLTPHRLCTYVDISRTLLAQDTHQAEEKIRNLLYKKIESVLQKTFFGSEAGSEKKPAGLFYNQELVEIEDFADIADLEASIDDENISSNRQYLCSNKARAALRIMPKSQLTNSLLLEGGEIDGTPLTATSDIADKKMIYGDFSSVAIAIWKDIDMIVDPYTTAINNTIRIYLSLYADFKIVRPEGLAFAKIKED